MTDTREKIHTRTILIEGYRRADGLWDIEGEIQDVKTVDHVLKTYVHAANTPLHRMRLRITVDDSLTIQDAQAMTLNAPYNPDCSAVAPVYAQLKGLQIKSGFRAAVANLVGGTRGCTHITELIGALATGAVQTTAGRLPAKRDDRPLSVGGCYAFRESGPVVKEFYPKWYRSGDSAD